MHSKYSEIFILCDNFKNTYANNTKIIDTIETKLFN